MKLCYVTMVFPASTETFACLDVRMLRDAGVQIRVYALRPARPRGLDEPFRLFATRARTRAANAMLADRGLETLPVSHSTWTAVFRGLRIAVTNPAIAVDVVGWICRNSWQRPRHCLKSFALLPRCLDIFAAIRQQRPDVVHLFWGHYPSIVGYLVRRNLQGVIVSMFLGAYDLRLRYGASAALGRVADVVWTHAHANIPTIRQLGIPLDKVRVVHRGIDFDALLPVHEREPHRLITAGRLTREKAVDDCLAVLSTLRESWPSASLAVIGDGPQRPRLMAQSKALGLGAAVEFCGQLSSRQVRKKMAAGQIFVLMSVLECLPNVVKEAMASGCACVVAETTGIRELVVDGVTGFIVPPGDIAAAAARLQTLLADPALAARMGAAGRDRVRTQFNARHSMRAYQTHWEKLMHTPHREGAVYAHAGSASW